MLLSLDSKFSFVILYCSQELEHWNRLGYQDKAQRASGERARASSTAVWETAVTQRVDVLNKTYINLTQLSFPLPTNCKK